MILAWLVRLEIGGGAPRRGDRDVITVWSPTFPVYDPELESTYPQSGTIEVPQFRLYLDAVTGALQKSEFLMNCEQAS